MLSWASFFGRCRCVCHNSCCDRCRCRRHHRRQFYFYSHFRCAIKLGFLRLIIYYIEVIPWKTSWSSLFGIFPWRTTRADSLFQCLRVFSWRMTRASFFKCSYWCAAKILDKFFFRMLYVGTKSINDGGIVPFIPVMLTYDMIFIIQQLPLMPGEPVEKCRNEVFDYVNVGIFTICN